MKFTLRIAPIFLMSFLLIMSFLLLWSRYQHFPLSDLLKSPFLSTVVNHRLAVLVPFRDRFTELIQFLPRLHIFLDNKGISHTFYIVNQVDAYRFNRGMLLNIGFRESTLMEANGVTLSDCEKKISIPKSSMIALHDVDLLPNDTTLQYEYVGAEPYHLIPYWLHPIYHFYPTYLGGAMLIARNTFTSVNGFSNRFWGWGREDDEFALRLRDAKLKVLTETKSIPLKPKFLNTHSKLHKREVIPYFVPATHTRDYLTGLNSLKYNVSSYLKIRIANADAWLINVELFCDLLETSYCLFQP